MHRSSCMDVTRSRPDMNLKESGGVRLKTEKGILIIIWRITINKALVLVLFNLNIPFLF